MTAGSRHKFTAICFAAFIFFFSIATVCKLVVEYNSKKNAIGGTFDDELMTTIGASGKAGSQQQTSKIKRIIANMQSVTRTTNEIISTRFYGRLYFINGYGLVQRVMGKRLFDDMFLDSVFCKDNHQILHFASNTPLSEQAVDNVATLDRYTRERKIPLLFVMAPQKVLPNYTVLPHGVADSSNANADAFLQGLRQKRVDYIDLRAELLADQLDKSKLFYKTDHHWTVETAFWAYQKVAHRLKDRYHFDIDRENELTNLNHFNLHSYPNSYLGTQGRRVGKYFVGKDDVTIITPKFDTSYTTYDYFRKVSKQGAFTDVIIDNSMKEYNAYLDRVAGHEGRTLITNNKQQKYKILVLKNSYARPVIAFLSLNVKEIYMLDLRCDHFPETVYQLIDSYKPDMVMFIYHAGYLGKDSLGFKF